ncbi:DNA polymerase III subunit epsilon [Pelagibius litoralis]|uniref:DNA polymerase III subunit epsilon n=1 Tax=Pelagibius litoralis TaxID=374515 RepID=UPI00197E6205|nr:DNA polymerase III subunit epsilon [Pelagibius litoralis]
MIDPVYVVTDIEVNGPTPGEHSMLAFASVAVDAGGEEIESFEAVLETLPGAGEDPITIRWFQGFPEAWAAATQNPEQPDAVMQRYAAWVRGLPGAPIFVAHPLAFDGAWIDFYLRRCTGIRMLKGPWDGERLFYTAGLCLQSFVAAKLDRPLWECDHDRYEPEWLGHVPHSHLSIDDARGYANLLKTFIRMKASAD